MNVLLLTPYPESLSSTILDSEDTYIVKSDPIDLRFCLDNKIDFLVSYGYRYIINQSILNEFPLKAVNLHISFLPRSRGAHPNFWSIVEGSVTGVTIHLLDSGLDTGNILIQREVYIDKDFHTFATSYQLLCSEIERLFSRNWVYIRRSESCGWCQQGEVTYHRAAEIDEWIDCLPQMWDTPIRLFQQLAAQKSGSVNPFMA